MQRLVEGVQRFLRTVHARDRVLFERLAAGQAPETLLITCVDSRVVPDLITQSRPGDVLVLRNAGNIVPPSDVAPGSEAAAVEFAVEGLRVRDVIVLGHADCGAMRKLLDPGGLPLLDRWLEHAQEARRVALEEPQEHRLHAAIEANVLHQLEHLQSYEFVARARAEGRLTLHGWVWDIASGVVTAFDAEQGAFLPL